MDDRPEVDGRQPAMVRSIPGQHPTSRVRPAFQAMTHVQRDAGVMVMVGRECWAICREWNRDGGGGGGGASDRSR